ncbi:MAG: PhzF family phenazine biosynthesis protein [Syntrophorhabdaceae bacterium]
MKIFHIDAFTNRPFHGNPAAVCILPHPKIDSWIESIAAELNLPVTAFIIRQADGYMLRWFTPVAEVDMCGHGTLAAAHIIWQESLARPDSGINFYTRSGTLRAWKEDDWIGLDFPSMPAQPIPEPEGLRNVLGVPFIYVGKNGYDIIVEVDSEQTVRSLDPDKDALRQLPMRGLILTGRSDNPEYDFVSRFFAPSLGISEDAVTGSAHCCLAPYWAKRLSRMQLKGYQASRRGGVIKMNIRDDRIHLFGQAITVISGNSAI